MNTKVSKQFVWCGITLLLLSTCAVLAQEQPTVNPGQGGTGGAATAQTVVLNLLPQATAAELGAQFRAVRPQNGMTDAQWYSRAARLAGQRSGPSMVKSAGAGVEPAFAAGALAAVDIAGVATPGASKNFDGLGEYGWTPADMGLAVGPTYIVQAVNSRITVLNKSGVVQLGFPKSLDAFFGLAAGSNAFDPRATFDQVKSRYIVLAERINWSIPASYIDVAVSATSNPLGAWYIYEIAGSWGQGANVCADFPTLGNDRVGIYIAVNNFSCTTGGFGGFINSEVYLLPKTQMYAGLGFGYWAQWGFNAGGVMLDTLQPVNVMNKSDQPRAEFMVNSFNINFGGGQCYWPGCNGLVIWAISNQFGFLSAGPTPKFTGVIIPTYTTYYLSLGAHQPGGSFTIDAGDPRISGAVTYTAGSIYASLTTAVLGSGPPEESSVLWWELHPILDDNGASGGTCTATYNNKCPALIAVDRVQEDCYFCGGWASAGSAYYGALQPDPERNLTMVFSYSSLTYKPGLAYVSRRVTQADNTMHDAGIMLKTGLAYYSEGRWGDYNGVAIDGVSATAPYMWFSGMYVDAYGYWMTRIGRNGFSNVNQP